MRAGDKKLTLKDGRVVGYAEYGAPDGKPVFYLHGANSTRLSGRALARKAIKLNIRVISIDRPGFGISEFQPGRQIIDWPDDAVAVADRLNIGRFAVLGMSAGSAYAAACALKIPKRLTGVGMVSCEVPHNVAVASIGKLPAIKMASFVARRTPRFMALLIRWGDYFARRFPELFFSNYKIHLAQPDRAIFGWSSVKKAFALNYLEAHRCGAKGAVWDMALVARDWGFNLEDISKKVHLWHGELDTVSPIAVGKTIAKEIPNCVGCFYPNEGHLSVLFNHMEEILAALVDK